MLNEQDFPFRQFFINLTTKKAVSIIAILGVLVYCNALFGAFVWDDVHQIQHNDTVQSLSNFPKFFSDPRIGDNLSVMFYRPLLYVALSLIYSVLGAQTFFFHAFQITLHIANAIILYFLLNALFDTIATHTNRNAAKVKEKEWKNLSGSQKIKYLRKHGSPMQASHVPTVQTSRLLSLFLSLLFLVHPINVEAVAYISGLNDPLYFLFGASALYLSLKEQISMKRMLIIGVLLLCSLFSKETGILFLLILLFLQFLFKKKTLLSFFIVEVVTLLIYSFMRFAIGGIFFGNTNPAPIEKLSFLARLANIPQIVLHYLHTMFFPLGLAVDQKWIVTKITVQDFYLPLLLDSLFFFALGIGGVYIYKHKKNYFPVYIFFFLWFISGLLLLIQIFPLEMTVADRWFYFPLIGILGMLGVGIQMLLFPPNEKGSALVKYKKANMVVVWFGVIVLLLLSVRTIVRNTNFRDEITLFTHDSQLQDNDELEQQIGVDYEHAGNSKAALPHAQKSVSLNPTPNNLFNLGYIYEVDSNDTKKAEEYYYKGIIVAETYYPVGQKHDPNDIKMYEEFIQLLIVNNRNYGAAEKIATKGLQYFPNSNTLWAELALSEYLLQKQNEALIAAEKAKTLAPNEVNKYLYTRIADRKEIPSDVIPFILVQSAPPGLL